MYELKLLTLMIFFFAEINQSYRKKTQEVVKDNKIVISIWRVRFFRFENYS